MDKQEVQNVSKHTTIEEVGNRGFEEMKSKHGLGSVYFNKGRDCWQAAFYMIEDGKKKRKILSAPTYDEAVIKMATMRAGQMAYVREEDIPTPKVYHTIKDIWDYILNVQKKGIKEATKKWYSEMGAIIIQELGNKNIEDLTSEDVQKFLNNLKYCKDGSLASESRVKKTSEQLKLIIKYALNEGYIIRNPFNDNIKRPKGVDLDPRKTAFEVENTIKLLEGIKHSESIAIRTVVPALLLTGMRIGEFYTLGYSDLNREEGTIHIHHSIDLVDGKRVLGTTKTAAGNRVIPVPPVFFDVIDNWKTFVYKDEKRIAAIESQGNQDIIFVGNKGEIRNPDSLRADLSKVLKELGLKQNNTTFHGLRRTYATLLSRSGVEDKIIAKLLGHEVPVDEGCEVAIKHYILEDENGTTEEKRDAINKYMEFMGDVFEKNIYFTHLKKRVKR